MKHYFKWRYGFGVALGIAAATMIPANVSAYSGTGYFTGDEMCTTNFTGVLYCDGTTISKSMNNVMSGSPAVPSWAYAGITEQEQKDNFYAWLKSVYDGSDTRNKLGAQVIAATMMGWNQKSVDMAALKTRLSNPALTLEVINADPNNYGSISFSGLSSSGSGVRDIFFTSDYDTAARDLILFKIGDAVVYVVEIPCANPVGGLPGIPDYKVATWTLVGESAVSTTTAVPGQVVNFSHRLGNNGPDQATGVWWTVRNQDGGAVASVGATPISVNVGWINGIQTEALTIPAAASVGDKFCRYIEFSPSGSNPAQGLGSSTQVCVTVVYDYELKPSVTTSTTTLVGTNATFNFAVNNTGPTKTNSTVTAIREIIIPAGVSFPKNIGGYNDDVDCSNYAVGGVTCTTLEVLPAQVFPVGATPLGSRTASTVGRNPGDRVCRVLSVISRDETPGLAGPPWHNRDQVNCTVIAAAPFMAGVGADMSAGGAIMAQCTGLPNPNPGDTNGDGKLTMADCPAATPPATAPCIGTAGFTGAGSSIGVATPFGSFGDYGIIATGPVSNFVSGAQMAPSAQSYLTFANTPTLGGYRDKHCITDYAQAYKDTVSATTAGGWTTWGAPGVKNINSPSFSLSGTTITKGQVYTIYAPNSVITITGNINYSPNNITRFGEAPSLTIIAKKIVVNSDVTLLNGVFYASELFSTCAQATDLTTNSATADKTAISATGACRPQLTINGAVIAKKLLPLRTAGGTNPSTPAEIIRLRPDAFLRARDTDTGAILTVDMISELPQRN